MCLKSSLDMAPSLSVSYTWNTTGGRGGERRDDGRREVRGVKGREVRKGLTLNLLVSGIHCVLVTFLRAPEPSQCPHKLAEVHLLHGHLSVLPTHTQQHCLWRDLAVCVCVTHSSVKKASMMRVPRGLTASSGINIRSCRLRSEYKVTHYSRVTMSTHSR